MTSTHSDPVACDEELTEEKRDFDMATAEQELRELLAALRDADRFDAAARVIVEEIFQDKARRRAFLQLGWDVTRAHFYSPTPDLRELPETLWTQDKCVDNLGWDADAMLRWVDEQTQCFGAELRWPEEAPTSDPTAFYVNNRAYRSGDAEPCYFMMRSLKPRRVIELGSGMSSKLIASALERNRAEGATVRYDVYDLYPEDHIGSLAVRGVDELHKTAVQSLPLVTFDALEAGDVLFIDTSHVLRIGSDVEYEYSQILPRLRPGVIVHIHDVFLPLEYPKTWIFENNWCWNEQYLVQAILANGGNFDTLYAAAFMWRRRGAELAQRWPHFDPKRCLPAGLWLRKRGAPAD